MRSLRPALVPLLVAGLLTGCGSGLKPARVDPSASSRATETPTLTPATPPRAPGVGACYRLDLRQALSPTSGAEPVSCKGDHTAVTMFVGRIDPIVDGHLLAVDAKEIQDQIATTCPTKVPAWVGGSDDDLKLSRFTAIWFSPNLEQSDAGADWFRCDVVAVAAKDQLAKLPGRAEGALDADSALDTFGTCGSSAPSDKGFTQVICARPHSWQAVKVIPIPPKAKYLGAGMQTVGVNACRAEAQQRATNPLVLRSSFEWPTKVEWDAGRRYGLCWVPSTAS